MEALRRLGRVLKNNYTNAIKPEMYICRPPGCGGAILKYDAIRQTFGPHPSTRRKIPELVFGLHLVPKKRGESVSAQASWKAIRRQAPVARILARVFLELP